MLPYIAPVYPTQEYAPQAYPTMPVYFPPPETRVDQGITIDLDGGGQMYLARDAFVKIGDAQAKYWVYDGQLHAFTS
jgi:hypothetical protein